MVFAAYPAIARPVTSNTSVQACSAGFAPRLLPLQSDFVSDPDPNFSDGHIAQFANRIDAEFDLSFGDVQIFNFLVLTDFVVLLFSG